MRVNDFDEVVLGIEVLGAAVGQQAVEEGKETWMTSLSWIPPVRIDIDGSQFLRRLSSTNMPKPPIKAARGSGMAVRVT